MNRRDAISTLTGAALAARGALAQQNIDPPPPHPPPRVTPQVVAAEEKPGARPLLCVYSGCLAKIPYGQLSEIVRQMGYDGCDLTVMKGGHVDPSLYMVDLDRAFQTFQDAGLDLPMVTTSFTSPTEPWAYAILYVSAELGARYCRLGTWPPAGAAPQAGGPGPLGQNPGMQNADMRAMLMRNELAQFARLGLQCKITPLLANHAGSYPGRSIPEAEAMLTGLGRTSFGYCFDPVQAVIEAGSASGWEAALQASLPRLGAVALSDVALEKDAAPRLCAIGEGVIDWKRFFAILAGAHFHGPVSMHMDYEAHSQANAMTKDLAFVRARVEEAWPL